MARAVCVLGMHRSGTSLITRVLNLLGVYLGPEEHLITANADNPKGFWEHDLFKRRNDEILERLGGTWHDSLPYRETRTARCLGRTGEECGAI